MSDGYYARSENEDNQRQLLKDHLHNVAERAAGLAEAAGLPAGLGRWAGWLHDLGKYSDEFQVHLAKRDRDLVEHAAHGAAIAAMAGAGECAFAVAAHHSGLATKSDIAELLRRDELTATLTTPRRVADRAREFRELAATDAGIEGQPARSAPAKGEELAFELRTRMLLSCLADADRLDAEAWMGRFKPWLRTTVEPLDPAARLDNVLAHIQSVAAGRKPSDVTRARDEVLQAALARASERPGFFSLTVPTGGGKTLASLAFALAQAAAHGKRRLIFVVPFLTVIEQNADVIRTAVGETGASRGNVVLEHHSGLRGKDEPDGQSHQEVLQRLLAENWDAPVVITTAVQFFHSLFSNHPTDLRKVHNIANSVVVFDEAQTFPPGMMAPLVGMLRQLVDEYRVTAVFCTATQPALSQDIRGKDGLAPLVPPGSIREIAPDPPALFRRLKRVEVHWPGHTATPLADVASAMAARGKALAVVNTKKQARELFHLLRALDPTAVHLSTRMCAAHRRDVVAEIRRRLAAGEPCLVASTQLIEAGVDISFDDVWRAFGPLEGVAQVAGRCNREGLLDGYGQVTVFRTEDGGMPRGVYASAAALTDLMLGLGHTDIDHPATFTEYFTRLYNVVDTDAAKVVDARQAFDFPAVRARFRVIDEDTTAVLVPYGDEGRSWVERVTGGAELGRGDIRRMQPYLVSLYPGEFQRALNAGLLALDNPIGVPVFTGAYDDALGLVLGGEDPLED